MGSEKFLANCDLSNFHRRQVILNLSKALSSIFSKIITSALIALFAIQSDLIATPTLSITQSPSLSITKSNLSGATGTDLTSPQASSSMNLVFTVTETAASNNVVLTQWSCYCSLGSASSNWPANLSCSIKLSSVGSSNATSSTNGAYVTLTSSQQKICAGSGNGSGITLQCQLSNVSLANCPPTSSTATLPIILTLNSS